MQNVFKLLANQNCLQLNSGLDIILYPCTTWIRMLLFYD